MIMLSEQEEAVRRYGNERAAEARAEGQSEGKIAAYIEMIADGVLTIEKAAAKLGMTVKQFREAAEAVRGTT